MRKIIRYICLCFTCITLASALGCKKKHGKVNELTIDHGSYVIVGPNGEWKATIVSGAQSVDVTITGYNNFGASFHSHGGDNGAANAIFMTDKGVATAIDSDGRVVKE